MGKVISIINNQLGSGKTFITYHLIFLTKQSKGVMIGALNDLNLWCVDAVSETLKTK